MRSAKGQPLGRRARQFRRQHISPIVGKEVMIMTHMSTTTPAVGAR
jgi:hypothetical protein